MKKIIKIFISVLIIIFIFVLYMDYNDKRYEDRLKNKIINNTDVKEIEYINYYDSYYIVMDMENIYVLDNKYIGKLLVYEYYDLYTYELYDRVLVGGNYE